MLRTFIGLVYGVALVIASVAVAGSGHGFTTFFGVVGAPFAFFANRVDHVAMVAIPLFWASLAFMAHLRRAWSMFIGLMCLHYGSAILWLLLRRSDIGGDLQALQHVSIFVPGALLIYAAGQILLWRDYRLRS